LNSLLHIDRVRVKLGSLGERKEDKEVARKEVIP
jgi:hypothetical protein